MAGAYINKGGNLSSYFHTHNHAHKDDVFLPCFTQNHHANCNGNCKYPKVNS